MSLDDIPLFDITIYLGLLGLIMMLFSFLTGMKIIKIKPKYHFHKKIGIIGFCAASIHGLVMCYFYFFN